MKKPQALPRPTVALSARRTAVRRGVGRGSDPCLRPFPPTPASDPFLRPPLCKISHRLRSKGRADLRSAEKRSRTMRTRLSLAAVVLTVIAGVVFPRHSAPEISAARSEGQDSSTLDDQVELAVTVYNSDIALVRDVRD